MPLPVRHHAFQKGPEGRSMIVLLQVTQFMQDHIINAVTWGFDQMRVQRDGHYPVSSCPTASA